MRVKTTMCVRTTKALLIGFVCAICAPVFAGDLTGTVKVFQKGGKKPLESADYALVYLSGLDTPPPGKSAVLKQENKKFIPRLLPVVKGQTVKFLNGDRVRHNVFSPNENESFDLGRYPKGKSKDWTFKTLGPHNIYCNIHQQMIADVFVLTNKYFSVTDAAGAFSIKGVPPGTYTLHVWHIYGGLSEKKITVTADAQSHDLSVTCTKVLQQLGKHKNKSGGFYDDDEY